MEYRNYLAQKTKEELIDIILDVKQGTRVVERCFQRKIALRICYDGRRYSGLVHQKNERTIEDFLKNALVSSRLANPDIRMAFAGRTDKKVSASGMVMSVLVNSLSGDATLSKMNSLGSTDPGFADQSCGKGAEFNYDTILNTNLPPDIRITGWCPVPMSFCSRHSCKLRRYKYFFSSKGLDVPKMRQACLILKEGKNFQNLSRSLTKKEASKIPDLEKYFYRPICDIYIEEHQNYSVLNVSSRSFLHNMIRKIIWLLKEVGRGREDLAFVQNVLSNKAVKCGTERPEFLVFSKAEYEPKLVFSRSEKHLNAANNIFIESLVQRDVIRGLCRMA